MLRPLGRAARNAPIEFVILLAHALERIIGKKSAAACGALAAASGAEALMHVRKRLRHPLRILDPNEMGRREDERARLAAVGHAEADIGRHERQAGSGWLKGGHPGR